MGDTFTARAGLLSVEFRVEEIRVSGGGGGGGGGGNDEDEGGEGEGEEAQFCLVTDDTVIDCEGERHGDKEHMSGDVYLLRAWDGATAVGLQSRRTTSLPFVFVLSQSASCGRSGGGGGRGGGGELVCAYSSPPVLSPMGLVCSFCPVVGRSWVCRPLSLSLPPGVGTRVGNRVKTCDPTTFAPFPVFCLGCGGIESRLLAVFPSYRCRNFFSCLFLPPFC